MLNWMKRTWFSSGCLISILIFFLFVKIITITSITDSYYSSKSSEQETLIIEDGFAEGGHSINILAGGCHRAESFSLSKACFIESVTLSLFISGTGSNVDVFIQVYSTTSSLLPDQPISPQVFLSVADSGLTNFTSLSWLIDPSKTFNNTFLLVVFALHSSRTVSWGWVLDSTNGDQADVLKFNGNNWVPDDNNFGGGIDFILQMGILTPSPPLVNIISPFSQVYGINSIDITVFGNCANYWYFIEGVDNQNQTLTANLSRTLADGNFTLHVYGNNSAGTIAKTSVVFTIDTTPPIIVINSPDAKTYKTDTVMINLSGEAICYWYFIEGIDLNNHTWLECINRTFEDCSFTIHAYGNDTAGNINHTSVTFIIELPFTTTQTTSSSSTTTWTTRSGSFLDISLIIFSFTTLVVVIRRFKKI